MLFEVNEECTFRITGTLLDEMMQPVPVQGTSINATLYDKASGEIINGRDHQDIKNTNGGSLGADGAFAFVGDPEDSVIVDPTVRGSELHILLIEWGYQVNSKRGKMEVQIAVRNLSKVPQT